MAARKNQKPTARAPVPAPPPVVNQQPQLLQGLGSEHRLSALEDHILDVVNAQTSRFNGWLGQMMDPRRDIFAECGFPKSVTPQMYQDLVDRNPYAARACEVMPKEACQTSLKVYEGEPDEENEFNTSRKELNKQLNGPASWYSQDESSLVDSIVEEAAIAAGAGHYAVVLIGLNDGLDLSEPVPGVEEAYSMPVVKPPEPDLTDTTDPKNPVTYKDPIANWSDPYSAQGYKGASAKTVVDLRTPSSSLPRKISGVYSLNMDGSKHSEVLVTNLSNPDDPKVEKSTQGERTVSYLRVFPETRAMITRWESNRTSPRYNQPVSYLISLDAGTSFWNNLSGMPTNTVDVHWTRVVHVPGPGKPINPVASEPLLQPVLNPLLNLDKIVGASGEAYWKRAFNILVLKTIPQLGPNVKVNKSDLKDQVENLENSQQNTLYLNGMEATTVSPEVVDPTPHIQVNVSAVCVQLSIPVPVFQGYEIGEQASENNDAAWADRVSKFQRTYLVSKVAVPLHDRLILVGALAQPGEDGYKAEYEALDRQTAREKAEIAGMMTTALAAYVSGGLAGVISEEDYLVDVWKFDRDLVTGWLERSAERQAEIDAENEFMMEQQAEMMGEQGFEGFENGPPGKPGQPPPFPPGKKPAPGAKPNPFSTNEEEVE